MRPEWLRNVRLGSIARMYVCFWGATYDSRSGSSRSRSEYPFGIDCTRQLVCGSSRNLNPMILGTDPSRVPNLCRGLPLALKVGCLEKGRRANEEASASGARENFSSRR